MPDNTVEPLTLLQNFFGEAYATHTLLLFIKFLNSSETFRDLFFEIISFRAIPPIQLSLKESVMDMSGLYLIKSALKEQCRDGLTTVEPNKSHGGNNIWGHLYTILEQDRALAELVRQSFLKKSPQEALVLVEKIRRECFEKELQSSRRVGR